jgi:CRP-like cAMP-binding protein
MTARPPLWDFPVEFALSSLEGARVRMTERCLGAGETIYVRGDPNRHLYFLTEGVVKPYKTYGGHKEVIVTLLEGGAASLAIPRRDRRASTATLPRRLSFAGSS